MTRTGTAGGTPAFVLAAAVVAAFAGAIALAIHQGRAPAWLGTLYAVASAVTAAAYGMDKAAAVRGARRTPERTLHALALAGGWPGALVAQRLFRHKTAKPSFLAACWLTVALHVATVVAILWLPRA